MESLRRTFNFITLAFSLILLTANTGCSGFEANSRFHPGAYDPSESDEEFVTRVDANIAKDNASTKHPLKEVLVYDELLSINFGQVARLLDKSIKKARAKLWVENCKQAGTFRDKRSKAYQYRCGELPVGKIINGSTKNLLTVNFAGAEGKSDGVKYSLSGANIPFYLARGQTTSTFQLANLDNKKVVTQGISNKVLGETYFKLEPKNGVLYTQVCTYAPGSRIYANAVQLKGKLKKKAWIFSLKSDVKVTIQPGSLSFKNAQVCALVKTTINNSLQPKVEIVKVLIPKFNNLKLAGFKSTAKADAKGLLGFIDKITSIVGYDIEKKIESAVRKEIDKQVSQSLDKIKTGDIQSGKWMEKYLKVKGIEGKLVKNLNSALQVDLRTKGPGKTIDLKNKIAAACLLLGEQAGEAQKIVEDVCRYSFTIQVRPFVTSSENASKGCYKYFFNPEKRYASGKNPRWWVKDCRIENRVTLHTPGELARLYSCVADALRNEPKDLEDGKCDQELEDVVSQLDTEEFEDIIKRAEDLKDKYYTKDIEKEVIALAEEIFGNISF